MKRGCLVIQDGNIWPLLLDIILPIGCEKPLVLTNPFPDSRMLKMLLDQGADPNRGIPYSPYGNMTPWEYLLWKRQDDFSHLGLDPWLEIVPQFLAYGAHPRAITNSRFRVNNVRNNSLKTTYQVGDALYTYLRSKNGWFNWGLSVWPRCDFSETDIQIIKECVVKRPKPKS